MAIIMVLCTPSLDLSVLNDRTRLRLADVMPEDTRMVIAVHRAHRVACGALLCSALNFKRHTANADNLWEIYSTNL